MIRYVLFRLAQLLPVLLLASVGVWLMMYLIPGDPAVALLGPDVTPEQIQRTRTLMGLDRPLPVQYALWLGRVVRGDLGVSYLNGLPVTTMLAQRIPVTLQLTVASLVVALAIAAPLGVVSAVRPRSWIARVVTGRRIPAPYAPWTTRRSCAGSSRSAPLRCSASAAGSRTWSGRRCRRSSPRARTGGSSTRSRES